MWEGVRLNQGPEQKIENDQLHADEMRHHRHDQNVLRKRRGGDDRLIDHEKKLDEPRWTHN